MLNLDSITSLLETGRIGRPAGWANELWDKIGSTNTRACELACAGAPEGVMVIARQQTAGRGRQGRRWLSPPDAGLYVSFLLRPDTDASALTLYTLAAGVAAYKAILRATGVETGLKWVNDIIYAGRKLGGILAEVQAPPAAADLRSCLVIGAGINIRQPQEPPPEDLSGRIAYLESICGAPVDANLLVAYLARALEDMVHTIETGDTEAVLNLWRKYSITLGQQVKTISGTRAWVGRAVDIGADGALILELSNGKHISLAAGDISIRATDGRYI